MKICLSLKCVLALLFTLQCALRFDPRQRTHMAMALELTATLEARCIATGASRRDGSCLKRPSTLQLRQECSPIVHVMRRYQRPTVRSSLYDATAQRQDEEATTELELNLRQRRPVHERYGVKIERGVSKERLQVLRSL